MSAVNELAHKLRKEGEKFSVYFESLSDQQWAIEVYTEDSVWTIRSTLAHLMTAERAFRKLFENILRGGEGVTEDFVIDRYNASQQEKTKELDRVKLLEQYRNARNEMINFVTGLDDADLEKTGRHPFLGLTSLHEMIKMVYIHNQTHYRDIKKALQK